MANFGRDPGRLRRHPGPPAALSLRDPVRGTCRGCQRGSPICFGYTDRSVCTPRGLPRGRTKWGPAAGGGLVRTPLVCAAAVSCPTPGAAFVELGPALSGCRSRGLTLAPAATGGSSPGCPLPNPRARSSSRDTGYGEVPPRSSAGGLATYGCGIPGRSPHPELYYLRWSEFRTCDDARLRRRPPPTPTGLLLVVNRLHEEVDVVE